MSFPIQMPVRSMVVTRMENAGDVRKVSVIYVGTHVVTPSFNMPWMITGNNTIRMPKPSHACFPVFAVFAAVDSALSTSAVSSSGFFPHFSIFSNPMIQITDITHRQIAAAPNTALHPISHITTAASRYEASVPTTCEDTILTQNFIFCSRLTISAKIRITGGQIIACA